MHVPSVRLRISVRELRLILPGLRAIVSADRAWRKHGRLEARVGDIRFYEARFDPAEYEPSAVEPCHRALKKLISLEQAGGRFRLSHFELAACQLAVRHTARMVRHGHLQTWLDDHDAPAKRLLIKLELYRRRARRLYERQLGTDLYLQGVAGWEKALNWIRQYYLWCRCNKPKGWSNLHRWFKTVVDRCQALAVDGLKRRSCYSPTQPELRKMVRAALRSVRKGNAEMTIRTILEQPDTGADFLAEFIVRCHGDSLKHCDLSTKLSDKAERLRALHGV